MPKHLIAKEGILQGRVIILEGKEEWKLGRDFENCDIVLEDKKVSREHALIYNTEEGLFLKNLSSTNPVKINGHIIKEDQLLKEGDEVRIGETSFLYSTEDVPANADEKKAAIEPQESHKTIFETEREEEVKEEEKESRFILKVISGPNAGAEMALEPGHSYIIGKEESDIALNDPGVSKKHARINIDSQGTISIEDLGSKNGTLVNSSKIEGVKIITSQDLLTIGASSFLIWDRESSEETIFIPSPQTIVEEKIAPLPERVEKEDWRKKKIPKKIAVLGGTLTFALFILMLGFFSLFKTETLEVSRQDYVGEIRKSLAKFQDVKFSYSQNTQSLFLTGHVLTKTDYEELKYFIQNFTFLEKVQDNVIIDELIWKNVNDILATHPEFRGVSMHSPQAGKYVLTGYLDSQEILAQLNDYINVNFPYLDRLQNVVVVESILNQEIATKLFNKGFGAITFQLANGEVTIAGFYPEEKKKEFQNLLEEIKKMVGIRAVKNIAAQTSEEGARIDLTSKYAVAGAVLGNKSKIFGVQVNGQIVSQGDFLDGMKITEIKTNVIYLEKDGLKYKINYNQ